MMLPDQKVVLDFISKFTDHGKKKEVIHTFRYGCCYWFARILYDRFCDPTKLFEIRIMYTQENHFGCKIGHHVYDITGDVTNEYKWEEWPVKNEEGLTKRLYRDCIYFLENDNEAYVIE